MTKFNYTCVEDKELIIESFNKVARLIFGHNKESYREFIDLYKDIVKEINIYQGDYQNNYICYKTPGICRLDKDDKLVIEMLGFNKSKKSDYDFIKHEALHEFVHSFADLLPFIYATYIEKVSGKFKYQIHMGLVEELSLRTGRHVGQYFYGKMFNETMMDLIAFIIEDNNRINDILFNPNYVSNVKTQYSLFYQITQLAIVAFSNKSDINYLENINNNQCIFDLREGDYYVNDFLYGILFNPLYIGEKYDKYMGDDGYLELCHSLDKIFTIYVKKNKLDKDKIKECLGLIKTFFKLKCKDYLNNDFMTKKDVAKLVIKFNNIWNYLEESFK